MATVPVVTSICFQFTSGQTEVFVSEQFGCGFIPCDLRGVQPAWRDSVATHQRAFEEWYKTRVRPKCVNSSKDHEPVARVRPRMTDTGKPSPCSSPSRIRPAARRGALRSRRSPQIVKYIVDGRGSTGVIPGIGVQYDVGRKGEL